MANRTDPEKHKEQVRSANRARYRATQRLISENQMRFDELYAEEASVEGVQPKPRHTIDAGVLQKQIATLQERLARVQHETNGSSA